MSLRVAVFALCIAAAWGEPRTIPVLDVEAVRAAGDPAQWVHQVAIPANPSEIRCDILVAGGGLGGVAAALHAAHLGSSVCLTEETHWIGGQLTAGGVSALDENRFIEFSGGTRSYYRFRREIRDYYRTHFILSPGVRDLEDFNPGACYVSPLCFEPAVGLTVLKQMLEPIRSRVQLFLRTKVIDLELSGGKIQSALAFRFDAGEVIRIRPKFVLDATETGDLLPLAHVPYSAGSESKSDTGEPDAGASPNPGCVQSFTYTFIVEDRPGEQHRIVKPVDYEQELKRQKFSLVLDYPKSLGWAGEVRYKMFGDEPPIPNNQSPGSFFSWRRVLARKNFSDPHVPNDLALINWPRQDYASESILDREPVDEARILQQAKRVSLAFLYWLQTDVPREDNGGSGYPELMLRADQMGTPDGLSMTPYIRESRRLRGSVRVVEQDIGAEYQKGSRARWFSDSIGTGFYMIDIHPCGAGEHGHMMMPKPFQIPMRALIPEGVSNLLAAGKSLSVTHITNGAFRLHPVEWNVGEAAGAIASMAIRQGRMPAVFEVQRELAAAGVPLVWFDDLNPDNPHFAAVQLTAIAGMYPLNDLDIHASLDSPVTRAEAAQALAGLFHLQPTKSKLPLDVPDTNPKAGTIRLAIEQGWMATDYRNWFHPDVPFYWTDWRENRFPHALAPLTAKRTGPVRRSELADRLLATLHTCAALASATLPQFTQFLQGDRSSLNNTCIIQSIRAIGNAKYAPAVNVLVKYLDVPRPLTEGIFIRLRIVPFNDLYPAMTALLEIGEPSVPALANVLSDNSVTDLVRENAARVIFFIRANTPDTAIALVLEASRKLALANAQDALVRLAREMATRCMPEMRAKCIAALQGTLAQ
ncbi:MAG TPA: FAD-dependent oxidoreductase [Bryobacteraceae bacterium]|nr:FAD-dependent oxidoreductase [Bryobacteraceae bacterium]